MLRVAAIAVCHPERIHQARGMCKECYNLLWRTSNPEKMAAAKKNWRLSNAARKTESDRRWYLLNQEKQQKYTRAWRVANPEYSAVASSQRRAREASADRIESIRREVVFGRDSGVCYLCKLPVNPDAWHLDHIIPLTRGGNHTYDNVAVSHPECNCRKYNKLVSELTWIQQ